MTAAAPSSPPDVERFRSIVRGRTGLFFDDGKLGFLEEILRRRIDETGRGAASYLADLEAGARGRDELRALVRELTVAETYFFRNVEQFEALREVALPERARAAAAHRRVRILSAGCASGEEAYSVAIVAREHPVLVGFDVSIRGVDVNPVMLRRAAAGCYSTWALRETSEERRARYFRPEGRDFVLDTDLRAAVTFEERNLAEPEPGLWQTEAFDIVFCRNLLMYLAPEAARALVDRIARSLVQGGYLFLGSAETLRGLSQSFHLCHTHGTFYYQKSDQARRDTDPDPPPPAFSPSAVASAGEVWVETIHRASERIRSLTAPPSGTEGTAAPAGRLGPGITKEAPTSGLGLAVELIGQERFTAARSALALLPPASARDPDVMLLKAILLTHGGDLAAAEALCDEVLALDEMNAGAHYLTALCRERAGDGRGAADHDQAAVYLDPGFAMPHLHLGLLARRAGDQDTARRELSLALALLAREDSSRLLMFGGGFGREGLISLCRAELFSCGGKTS